MSGEVPSTQPSAQRDTGVLAPESMRENPSARSGIRACYPIVYKPVGREPHLRRRRLPLGKDITDRLADFDQRLTMRIRVWNERSSARVTRRHERMIRMVKAIAKRILRAM
jgi:hypothetical protein